MQPKKYEVCFTEHIFYRVPVEAANKDEAIRKANVIVERETLDAFQVGSDWEPEDVFEEKGESDAA